MTDEARRVAMGLGENEKRRLLEGRTDWREDEWQDHCGDWDCEHCKGSIIFDGTPNRLSDADKSLRTILQETENAPD